MTKPAARLADICTGHRRAGPRPNNQGSPDVFINGRPAHRQTDSWPVHRRPKIHKSYLASGSPTVYTNGLQQGRVGDPVACGSKVATGSPDVFVGSGSFSPSIEYSQGPGLPDATPNTLSTGSLQGQPQEQDQFDDKEPLPEDEPPEDLEEIIDEPLECDGPVTVKYVAGFGGRTRNKPIQPSLMGILRAGANAACVDVVIYSGGQDPPGPGARRTGSRRHDNGWGSDVWIYYKGKQLSSSSSADLPRIQKFIQACKGAGATGIGMGNGYMGNVGIHVDNARGQPGVGAGSYWGGSAMSSAGAPGWLRSIMA